MDENPKTLIPAYDDRNKEKRTKQRNKSRIKFKEINKLRKKERKRKENEETPSKMAEPDTVLCLSFLSPCQSHVQELETKRT
jgi:phosphopantothenoylcysteine synthetase/decarboxylase